MNTENVDITTVTKKGVGPEVESNIFKTINEYKKDIMSNDSSLQLSGTKKIRSMLSGK